MKIYKIKEYKEYSIFLWLAIIAIIGLVVTTIYSNSKNQQSELIKSSIGNTYLKKTIEELTKNLEPRYTSLTYISQAGDTYESIVNKLDVGKKEKKLLLDTILNENTLKILRVNQKFKFKFDNLSNYKIIEFKIETDKKNEILFEKLVANNSFVSKKIKKNFKKNIVYKETIITNSLYNSAVSLGIKPNIIIEFARLYGFQVDPESQT